MSVLLACLRDADQLMVVHTRDKADNKQRASPLCLPFNNRSSFSRRAAAAAALHFWHFALNYVVNG
jgi:hypothetical protein